MATKLAITSDLYLPVTPPEQLALLARQMAEFRPDAAVLAGDLADSLPDLERCLRLFRDRLDCPLWVLPGDHDFWARPPHDSHRLWTAVLPDAVKAHGCLWLEGQAFTAGATAVAGTVAWYDYSSADPGLAESALSYAQQKYQYNADALRIDWEWSDPEFASLVAARFLATLDHLEADPTVRRTVVVTHFPILADQLPPPAESGPERFTRAYLGNLYLGQEVLLRRKVTHVVSGHTHLGRHALVSRPGAPAVEARVLAGRYEHPDWLALTLEG